MAFSAISVLCSCRHFWARALPGHCWCCFERIKTQDHFPAAGTVSDLCLVFELVPEAIHAKRMMSVQGPSNPHDLQAMAVEVGIDEASLLCLLPYCSKQLGLQGLACLAASSRGLRTACHSIISNLSQMKLLAW
jgi:hypothetical protein